MTNEQSNPLPPAILLQLMTGYQRAQAVYVAAKLGVPIYWLTDRDPVEELAAATQSHTSSLYRLLRALASVGVFSETSPRTFALTPTAALLRTGTPDSMRSLAITYNEEIVFRLGQHDSQHPHGRASLCPSFWHGTLPLLHAKSRG